MKYKKNPAEKNENDKNTNRNPRTKISSMWSTILLIRFVGQPKHGHFSISVPMNMLARGTLEMLILGTDIELGELYFSMIPL